jgi:hypothetical protein
MSMLCGLDLHRGQITFDALVPETGENWRGRIWSPDRARFRRWLAGEVAPRAGAGPVAMAVKARHDGKLAAISVARKLARRCYHTLRSLDPEVVYTMPERA